LIFDIRKAIFYIRKRIFLSGKTFLATEIPLEALIAGQFAFLKEG